MTLKSLPLPGVCEVDPNNKRRSNFTITWGELRKAWEMCFIDKTHTLPINQNHSTYMGFSGKREHDSRWAGFTIAEATEWLQHGYKPGLAMLNIEAPMQRERRRVHCAEEGEYQHDAALSGFDYPFLSWDKRLGKRGVRILYDLSINANTPAAAVNKYLKWIAEFSHNMEYADLDYSLGFTMNGSGTFDSSEYSMGTENIIIKSEDEAGSFQSWSSMLSPAAYRGYTFFAILLHSEKLDTMASFGLGRAYGPSSFQVNVEHDTETILVTKPESFRVQDVNPEMLTEKAKSLLENPFDKDM